MSRRDSHKNITNLTDPKLLTCLALEKLTYVIRNKPSEFFYIWEVFLDFVKNGDIEEALDVWSYGI